MTGAAELIADELRGLHKGRAVHAPNLADRLHGHLRELTADPQDPAAAPDRGKLIEVLEAAAARLTDDMATAARAALALSAETRNKATLKERVDWLATHIDREYRTAVRRMDEAEKLLSEEIEREIVRRRGRRTVGPDGWYLAEFRTVLRLDTVGPEAHEHRRVVATRDGISEIMAWMDAPAAPGKPQPVPLAEVTFGGQLIRREHPSGGRYQYVVQLARPLDRGESHEYGLTVRIPSDQDIRPHYIFTPECRCDRFVLRLRFDNRNPPKWVRRVNGETVRTFDDPPVGAEYLTLDAAGELILEFTSPVAYLGYGAQWQL